MYSCQNEFEPKKIAPVEQTIPDNTIKLGKKLENPFSVVNMQRALDTIFKTAKQANTQQARAFLQSSERITVKATDLYVRFLPKDSSELNLIEKDTTLILYDYPLDYEIEKQGEYYHDPDLSDDQITWQYTVVKPDYVFPKVKYEILSELFIPENSEGYREEARSRQSGSGYSKTYSLDKLETVSLYLTDNLSKEERTQIEEERQRARRICIWFICWDHPDPWHPSGTIKLWDDEIKNYYPMQGVVVRARRWFTTKTGITNSRGYFSTGSFRRPANYSIRWERNHFTIKWSWWLFWSTTAWYDGPKMRAPWNLHIRGGTQQYYATIFQAAHDYYYRYSYGLTKPSRWSWFGKLRIRARKKSGRSNHVQERRIWNGSDISLQAWGRPSDRVYGTTIHELAHAAHKNVDANAYHDLRWNAYIRPCVNFFANTCEYPGPFASGARRVMETWATTVEIALTRLRYRSYLGYIYYNYLTNYQDRSIAGYPHYTSVGEDMIDDYDQRVKRNNTSLPKDRVSGYTIKQIENSLRGTVSWGGWRENMKRQNPYNPTKQYLDELFGNY